MINTLNIRLLRPYVYILFATGIILSLLSAYLVDVTNQKYALQRLTSETQVLADATIARLGLYQYGLRGARGVILTAGEQSISRDVFHRYSLTREPDVEFPGARGFGFIRRVAAKDEPAFLDRARADGKPDFSIRELSPNKGERYIIQYIEPVDRNSAALGLDIASEATRRQAALSAMNSGKATLTGPITLVQATGKPQQSFLILLPIYKDAKPPKDEKDRSNTCIGWSYAPLLMSEVLEGLNLDSGELSFTLDDVTDGPSSSPFYSTASDLQTQSPGLSAKTTIKVYGRLWQLTANVLPAFTTNLNRTSPFSVMGAGALISLLLTLLACLVEVGIVRRRQIAQEQARISAIVESSADAIIGKTTQGKVTHWNHGAEVMFGYTSEEALGKCISQLITPESLIAEETQILSQISRGERCANHHTLRRHKDGHLLDVSISVAPIFGSDGSVLGASKTVRNISEQKAAEAKIHELNADLERQVSERTGELKKLNTLLGSILESASEISVVVTDTEGLIKIFNRGAQRMLGYSAEEITEQFTPGLFHLESEISQRAGELSVEYHKNIEGFRAFVEIAELHGSETREWTYVRKDQSHITVSLSVTAVRDPEGEIIGYLGIATDITSRKAFEKELASSLATTRAVLATAVNPVITLSADGTLETYNPAAERSFGYACMELEGINVGVLIPTLQDAFKDQSLAELYTQHCAGDHSTGLDVEVLRKDGSSYPAQMSLGLMDTSDNPMYVAIIADLTEQRRQHDEILAAHDHITLAAEVAKLGIWNWDLVKEHLDFNDQMYDMYALPKHFRQQGLKYEHWRNRIHPQDLAETELKLNNAIMGTGTYDPIFRALLPSGEIRFIQAAARVHYDTAGNATRITGINFDITEERRLQSSLREAKDMADAASAAKSSFLANMSHEIRTPMNAVLGMLYLVKQTELNKRQQDYITKAHSAATYLLGLLNDILDYSKIESGKLALDLHPFELNPLLQDLSTVLSGNYGEKDVEVIYDLDYNIPGVLIGDRMRLQQILINLAGNALKFTTQGQVVIGVRELSRSVKTAHLCISVKDTGIGISDEQQKIIFDGFTQAETSISRRFGGTGLGLVISRRLIQLMGGALQVESALGEGSCFWFELDLTIGSNDSLIDMCGKLETKLKLLIVDDNQEAADSLIQMTTALGWQADFVDRGAKAVDRVRDTHSRSEYYDIILMDWRMPDLDGLTAAEVIQGITQKSKIIMITAFGREVLIQEQNSATPIFADVLMKPVTPLQLVTCISEVLNIRSLDNQSPDGTAEHKNRLEGARILVVEDNQLNRQVAAELLSAEGAIVSLADGGLTGVQAVLSAAPGFDAILMDMQMPDIDGLEATRRIRADNRFSTLPILAMTANVTLDDQAACLSAGMNDHIGKPINNERLISCLLSYIGRRTTLSTPPPTEEVTADDLTESRDDILLRFGNNLPLIEQVLRGFAPSIEYQLVTLKQAISEHDMKSMLSALHTIKGSAGTMGAKSLSALAGGSEKTLKSGSPHDVNDITSTIKIDKLYIALDKSLQALRSMFPETTISNSNLSNAPKTEDWMERLEKLKTLLTTGNLDVLDHIDELTCDLPFLDEHKHHELIAKINELDFSSALTLIKNHSTGLMQ